MDPTLDSETLFLIVDYLRRNETLAPIAGQLETVIAEHRMLGCGERWDGTSYIRSYDDLIRKFPLATTVLRDRIARRRDDDRRPCSSWMGLAPPRVLPADTIFRRIQNRAASQLLRSCPPSLYGRYRHIKTIYGHHGPVFCVAFDRAGKRLITGSDDHRVKIWRTCDGALEYSLLGHTAPISDVAVSVCNVFVGSASADGTARLWYLRDGALVRIIQLNSEVTRLVFHPEYVLCTTMDGCAHALPLRDAAAHDVLTSPRPVQTPVSCEALSVSISSCQQLFAVGYSHGHIGFFSVDLLSEGFMSPFSDVDISSAGEIVTISFSTRHSEQFPLRIAVGSHRGKFHILARNDDGLFDIQHALGHRENFPFESTNLVVILSWAANDTKLVTTFHHSIDVWSTISGNLLFQHAIHKFGSDILSMSVHPLYTDAVFTVSVDGSAIVTSLIDGSEIVRFPATDIYQLIDCSFSPNADFICATSDLGRLVLFGTGSRRRHATLPDSQFFTFENPANNANLNYLPPPRILCDAEFETYSFQPRHLVHSHIARDLSEADSAMDSDVSEDLRPLHLPAPLADIDDDLFDPHMSVSIAQAPEAADRHLSEEEESFSVSSETENDEEDELDEMLSDEDLESFQIPVDMEIDSEWRGPNTRRTRRHDSGSDSDRPLRRHRVRQTEEAGNVPDSEPAPRRRVRRRRRQRRRSEASRITQAADASRSIRSRRHRTVDRAASQDRSSSRRLEQAQAADAILDRIRLRNRRPADSVPEQQNVAVIAAPSQRLRRRQNVLDNQHAMNSVPATASRMRTRSSLSNVTIPRRLTRQSLSSVDDLHPATPPATRRSQRAPPYSDQLLRARRQRTGSGISVSQQTGSAYNTRTQAGLAAAAAAAVPIRTSRRSPIIDEVIAPSFSPRRRRNQSGSVSPPRTRFRSGSITSRRTRLSSDSPDQDDLPLRSRRTRRHYYFER